MNIILQILSSWDAIEVEESCSEQHSLHFLTTWLGRQKTRRDCDVNADYEKRYSQTKKNKKGGINETLLTLPLCVLNSTQCSSNDDVQKLWRFANIIESSKEEEINGLVPGKHNLTKDDEKRSEEVLGDVSLNVEESNPISRHRRSKSSSNRREGDDEHPEEESSDSEESTANSLRHSRGCEFHETSSEKDEEMNYTRLESTIYHMNNKLQVLEKKMDTILAFVEQQTTTKKS